MSPSANSFGSDWGLRKLILNDQARSVEFNPGRERKAKTDSSVSILILSRNRPAILQETLASMILNASRFEDLIEENGRISIHVGIDKDDGETQSIMPNWPLVKWHVGKRPITIGEGFNHLWRKQPADYHVVWSDDKIIETRGWDSILLEEMEQDSMGYVPDSDHSRGAVTQYVLPSLWSDQAGYVAAKWFPYWFIDTWWDHVAAMIGNKRALSISMRQHPKALGTTGMKDLTFWARFFLETEPERAALANKIRNALWGKGSKKHHLSFLQQEHWRAIVRNGMINPKVAEEIEAAKAEGAPSERYDAAKSRAEAHLKGSGIVL